VLENSSTTVVPANADDAVTVRASSEAGEAVVHAQTALVGGAATAYLKCCFVVIISDKSLDSIFIFAHMQLRITSFASLIKLTKSAADCCLNVI
jgi:hypothetical protein